jgi:pimeloyl-ACP methyl ester carboxylesterase
MLYGLTASLCIAMLIAAVLMGLMSWQARRRYPPIGRFLECDGVRLHYLERGNPQRPAVLLLHGNGALIQEQTISGIVDLLAAKYRVLCFDRPGYGHSTRPRLRLWSPERQADLLAKALGQLSVPHVTVLGHSWGTLVGIALAVRSPQLVRGLVLASGYYFPTKRVDVWLMSPLAIPVIGDLFRFTLGPLLGRLFFWPVARFLFAPRPISDAFKGEYPVALSLRPISLRASAEESAFMIPAAARLQSEYPRLQSPVVIVVGEKDLLIEADQSYRLKEVLPRAVLRPVSDAGHMVNHAVPERLADAVDLSTAWADKRTPSDGKRMQG